jgi:hypothetical protein
MEEITYVVLVLRRDWGKREEMLDGSMGLMNKALGQSMGWMDQGEACS